MEMNKLECPSCGAPNDIIQEICLYCKSPLTQKDLKKIPTETLVEYCGVWIGRLSGAFISGGMVEEDGIKLIEGNYVVILSYSDVRGNAEKYLSLLEKRVVLNPELNDVVNRLNGRYKESIEHSLRKSKNENLMWMLIIGFAFILIIVFVFFA